MIVIIFVRSAQPEIHIYVNCVERFSTAIALRIVLMLTSLF